MYELPPYGLLALGSLHGLWGQADQPATGNVPVAMHHVADTSGADGVPVHREI